MRDPYSILGVRRNAGADEIKAAWRVMAKAVHPDQNRDDPLATQRFAEASRAYELLKDPKLRNRYDHARREAELRRMEAMKKKSREQSQPQHDAIDPETADEMISRIFGVDPKTRSPETRAPDSKPAPEPKPEVRAEEARGETKTDNTRDQQRDAATEEAEEPAAASSGFGLFPRSAAPAADLVSAIVRRIRGNAAKPAQEKVPDIACEVTVTVEDIFSRIKPTAVLPDEQTLKVTLPAGSTDGTVIRLKQQGYRLNGMLRGDVVVTVRVSQDGAFRTQGVDLVTTLPIDIQNAVLGCETTVKTLTGPVRVTVPAWSGSDRVLRLAGQGLPDASGGRGDLLVELRLVLGEKPDERVTDLMRSRREGLFL